MNFKRIDYQVEAIEKLIMKTEYLFEKGQASPILSFKAPTGSGKTIMTAKYIQEICTRFEEDICFVWLSIGKGELHIQSKKKLEKIFNGFPNVSLLGDEFFGSRVEINKNEVVVINWEAINNKDEDGNYTNILMKDGEKINFRQVLSNTRAVGRKIILIIDESHYSSTTERSLGLRKEIDPSLVLEMSATPKLIPKANEVDEGKGEYVGVSIKDVIDEEMIKEEIIINQGINTSDERNLDKRLLETAYQKRLELKDALENGEKSNVNPLVVIQIPNAEDGEDKKEIIIDFLKDKGITVEGGNLAIWLDNAHKNLDNISDNTNKVEFLIFKQAIDTGWDCPRAQILLRFREIKSFIFERQTLGRILRMPEQEYYKNSILNKAYVYTDFVGNTLDIIDKEFDFPDENIKTYPLFKKEEFEEVELFKEYVYRRKNNLRSKLAKEIFIKWATDKGLENGKLEKNKEILLKEGFEFDTSKLTENILSEIKIDSEEVLSDETTFKGDTFNFEIDEERTELMFRRILRKKSTALGSNRETMYQVLRERIYEFFFNYILGFLETEDLIINIQKLFILNYNFKDNTFFSKLIDDVINTYKDLNEDDLYDISVETKEKYIVPKEININTNTNELVNMDKYYYDQCYLQKDRFKPERDFEDFIKSNIDKVEFWIKNGDYGSDYFCIAYDLENTKREFYPDYIIKFNDGRLGIFEAKKDGDGEDKTKLKANRLYKYIESENKKGKNIFGGIVANFGTDNIYIKINNKEEYSTNFSDWDDLKALI